MGVAMVLQAMVYGSVASLLLTFWRFIVEQYAQRGEAEPLSRCEHERGGRGLEGDVNALHDTQLFVLLDDWVRSRTNCIILDYCNPQMSILLFNI